MQNMMIALWCLLLTVTVFERYSAANTSTGTGESVSREVVYCYFGALRKDGQIMVNMVPGAAGKVYRMLPAAPVTLNGTSVGRHYLKNGIPITLILNNQKNVDEIQVRPAGDR